MTKLRPRPNFALCLSASLGLALLAGCGDDSSSATGGGSTSDDTAGPQTSGEHSGGETSGSTTEDDPSETEGEETTGGETENEERFLTPVEHLVRISMALRGARPSLEELEAVEADPDVLPELVDSYMQGPGFAEIVRDLHNDSLLVAIERALPRNAPLDDMLGSAINASVQDTALRLVEHVVTEDIPYTEIVTADYWMVDETAAIVYGLPYDQGGDEWQQVDIPGPRPPAGLLSDNAMFLRHESAGANYHRGRANALASALLCQDFLDNDIDVDGGIDLNDPEAVRDAVNTNPTCLGCHATLDPLASHLHVYPGQIQPNDLPAYPVSVDFYQEQLVDRWETTTETPPGYYGMPSEGLDGLGRNIAADPRFAPCAAKRFYAYFQQVELDAIEDEDIDAFTETFEDSGMQARALIKAIVLSDDFRLGQGLDDDDAADIVGFKRARPVQVALLMKDLTGFEWEYRPRLEVAEAGAGTLSLARDASNGLEVLAGGIDSLFIRTPSRTVNATTALFLREFSAEAASFVVEQDFADGDAKLLDLVGPNERAEGPVRAQLVQLFARIYGEQVETDSADVNDAFALFDQTADAINVEHAWKVTLTAMLQDLNIIYY